MNLSIESEEKDRQSIERRKKNAGFPVVKTLDTFEWDEKRLPHLKKEHVFALKEGHYIQNRQNIIAVGNPGTGKTHLSISLGMEAIRQGYMVKFRRASELVNQMSEAQSEKRLTQLLKSLQQCHLLSLDELCKACHKMNWATCPLTHRVPACCSRSLPPGMKPAAPWSPPILNFPNG